MNSYTTPAYWLNGTVYVPVKLVCGKFGLTYSTSRPSRPSCASATAAPRCQIPPLSRPRRTPSAICSTPIPILAAGRPPPPRPDSGGNSANDVPTPIDPATGEPTENACHEAERSVSGLSGRARRQHRRDPDALEASGIHAAFFVPADGTVLDQDLLRQIVGRGHTVGFTLLSSAQDMPAKLRAANDIQ